MKDIISCFTLPCPQKGLNTKNKSFISKTEQNFICDQKIQFTG